MSCKPDIGAGRSLITSVCTLLIIAGICAISVSQAQAPQGVQERAAQTQTGFETPQREIAIPFPAGEKLVFEIRLSRFPIYATLGNITFEYSGPSEASVISESTIPFKPDDSEKLLLLRAEAVSKGFLASLVGFDVKNRYQAMVNRSDFTARISFKEIVEGKKHQTRTAVFDKKNAAVVYSTVDLTRTPPQPVIKEMPHKEDMHSLLSAIFYIRLRELADGEIICFPVSEDEDNHIFEIHVRGRETVEVGSRKIPAIRVEPKLFGPGRFFSREGEMSMWISDDERRLPLKLTAKTSAGTLNALITNYDAQPPVRPVIRQASPENQ